MMMEREGFHLQSEMRFRMMRLGIGDRAKSFKSLDVS